MVMKKDGKGALTKAKLPGRKIGVITFYFNSARDYNMNKSTS